MQSALFKTEAWTVRSKWSMRRRLFSWTSKGHLFKCSNNASAIFRESAIKVCIKFRMKLFPKAFSVVCAPNFLITWGREYSYINIFRWLSIYLHHSFPCLYIWSVDFFLAAGAYVSYVSLGWFFTHMNFVIPLRPNLLIKVWYSKKEIHIVRPTWNNKEFRKHLPLYIHVVEDRLHVPCNIYFPVSTVHYRPEALNGRPSLH